MRTTRSQTKFCSQNANSIDDSRFVMIKETVSMSAEELETTCVIHEDLNEIDEVNVNEKDSQSSDSMFVILNQNVNITVDKLEKTCIIPNYLPSEEQRHINDIGEIQEVEYQYTSDDFCGKCKLNFYKCRTQTKCIGCEQCGMWYHISCAGISKQQYEHYAESSDTDAGDDWFCQVCVPLQLPTFEPACYIDNVKWGKHVGVEIETSLNEIYSKVVCWQRNLFKLPSGASGKAFIDEISRLANLWTNKTNLESVSLLALHVLGPLLLQKPSKSSKNRDHIRHLTARLKKWKDGCFDDLILEAEAIQKRLTNRTRKPEEVRSVFTRLMLHGKISSALQWLSSNKSKPLDITPHVINTLKSKHPDAAPLSAEHVINNRLLPIVEPVIFENIDAEAICRAAKNTKGGAGPSGLDADMWRRILCSKSFNKASHTACESLSLMCRRLCTEFVDPTSISSLMSCRLIPLDKNPEIEEPSQKGVRPIGIGEVLRRIIGKAVTTFLKTDIINSVGPLQLSAGQEGGCEAAVHAMEEIFSDEDCQGVLLVDATNAFNSLNRETSLLNVRHICPEFATFLINTYRMPAKLFLPGGKHILSTEGTTQGDNCASGFYSISILPIIKELSFIICLQIWYADDAAAGGKLEMLKSWWDKLNEIGPGLGYFPNAKKTWLIVKPQYLEAAKQVFKDSGVQITSEGQRYLGAAIGTSEYKEKYVSDKVSIWQSELEELSEIAKSEPQLAYAAYIFGLSKRWLYIMRTMKDIEHLLQPLENTIKNSFLQTIVKHTYSQLDRLIYTMPAKFGGLGIFDPTQACRTEYHCSLRATAPLVKAIQQQKLFLTPEENFAISRDTAVVKAGITAQKLGEHKITLKRVIEQLTPSQAQHMELLCKKGTSSWLTTLPLEEFGFVLNKQEFADAICLRYNYIIQGMPRRCACGEANSINHALCCKKGGYVSMRHNQLRDLIAHLLSSVGCRDVQTEPSLIPIDNEVFDRRSVNTAVEARLDVSARGVWNSMDRTFLDVRVFHHGAPSNRLATIGDSFRKHENEKKLTYNRRIIQVEKATFTPSVCSTSGAIGDQADRFLKRVATLMTHKKGNLYSDCISYIRKKIRFVILRTVLTAIRGYRGHALRKDGENSDIHLMLKPDL